MIFFKQILRRFIPQNQWERLAAIKARVTVGLYLKALGLLPLTRAVDIKERIHLTGKLDYPGGNILMTLEGSIQLGRLHACKKEPETVEWIERHIHPGDVMYDVGANVGAYSFIAHLVTGGDCTIYAFEPSFSTFASLSRNVLLNYCDKSIKPLQVALSAETGLNAFAHSQIEPGAALHRLLNENMGIRDSFPTEFIQPILCYRLDDLIDQFGLKPPNLIKIDVDGGELKVLRGAVKTLGRPELRTVLIEIDGEGCPPNEILQFMKNMKFHVRSRHPRRGSEIVANYIFERTENS